MFSTCPLKLSRGGFHVQLGEQERQATNWKRLGKDIRWLMKRGDIAHFNFAGGN